MNVIQGHMTAFTINAENNVTVFAYLKEIQGSEETGESIRPSLSGVLPFVLKSCSEE